MHKPTIIRKATASDTAAVADVYLASYKAFLTFVKPAHTDDEVRSWIAKHLLIESDVHVSVLADNIVGMMALKRDHTAGWIDQLYLHPNAVNQGIGSQLIALAKNSLKSPIRLYTFQANEGARRFYERHGFKVIAFGDGSSNEEHCPDILLEWRK